MSVKEHTNLLGYHIKEIVFFLTLCPFSSQLFNMPNLNGSIQVLDNELLGLPITSLYSWNFKCLKLYSVMSLK